MINLFQQVSFLKSAETLAQLPADSGCEVAFAGRSNAGKSSTLNALCQQKHLAKISKTPGRTQLMNVFTFDDDRRLIDLPGYGYAKVSASIKERWQKNLTLYFEQRESLQGLVLVMDCRHPLTDYDEALVEWAVSSNLPLHILLNKADKLTRNEARSTLAKVQVALTDYPLCSVQLFSATEKMGLSQLSDQLALWLDISR